MDAGMQHAGDQRTVDLSALLGQSVWEGKIRSVSSPKCTDGYPLCNSEHSFLLDKWLTPE